MKKFINNQKGFRNTLVRPYMSPVVPETHHDARHVFHLYVIRVANRDELRQSLQKAGVQSGVHYMKANPYVAAYKHQGAKPADFPVAYRYQDEIVSLPIHGDLTEDQIDLVIDEVRKVAKHPGE